MDDQVSYMRMAKEARARAEAAEQIRAYDRPLASETTYRATVRRALALGRSWRRALARGVHAVREARGGTGSAGCPAAQNRTREAFGPLGRPAAASHPWVTFTTTMSGAPNWNKPLYSPSYYFGT